METAGKSTSTVDEQIEFCWTIFEDQRAITRAADLKAVYLVPFLLFFGASTIPLGTEVVPKMHWSNTGGALAALLYIATYALLTMGFVWSLVLISRAMTPRIAKHHQNPQKGSELLYYEHVLRHKDSNEYFQALSTAGPEQMLRNITDQVFELSKICKAKLDNLRGFAVSFKWTVVAWCISTAIGFWIIGRK